MGLRTYNKEPPAPSKKRLPRLPREAAKRPSGGGAPAAKRTRRPVDGLVFLTADSAQAMSMATHQIGLVEGEYDSKDQRLRQILERLPTEYAAIVFADPASEAAVRACVEACAPEQVCGAGGSAPAADAAASLPPHLRPCPSESSPAIQAEVAIGRAPELRGPFEYLINYDAPATQEEYVRRLAVLGPEGFVYTFVREEDRKRKAGKELVALLRRTRKAAKAGKVPGGAGKAAEMTGALGVLGEKSAEDEEEEEEQAEEASKEASHGDDCDCTHCRGRSTGGVSYHGGTPAAPAPRVELVRIPLSAIENLESIQHLIAPRLPSHEGTVVCLHNLYCHVPWDSWEHLFALPEGMGTVRVILVLATGSSWHDYPDTGAFDGGVGWLDILPPESMLKTDRLIEKLVDYETALLDGRSERVVLFGSSQGGGQSMLRFLRSQHRLGGFVGGVCHAPTGPHLPRDADPLLQPGRPMLNIGRPLRILCGDSDSTFPPHLVQRDAERLRNVGGFADVEVEVVEGLTHDGWAYDNKCRDETPLELLHLAKQLPKMLGLAPRD